MQKLTPADVVARYGQVPQKTRLGAAAAILAALVVLYFFLVQQDQQAALTSAQAALQHTESERAEKFAYAANLPLYETRLTELTEQLGSARAMLPDAADVPQFLSQIGGIAREVNLVIERFEPQPELPHDFYAETRFAVTARGSYHELGSFLDRVSRMDRIVNVADLTMDNPKVENLRVVVQGTFVLRAYRSMSADEMARVQEELAKKDGKK